MKAFLKNYRQSPRKVRLVADLIKGKDVAQAGVALDILAKRASTPIKKLLDSAVANAVNMGNNKEDLFVKEVRVDKGVVMKRMMPRAMGRGARINKRTSHVVLVLAEKTSKVNNKKNAKVAPTLKSGSRPESVGIKVPKAKKTTKVTKAKEDK
jgi:large subunit ribosomal protein L22